jgi:hypothetical protein
LSVAGFAPWALLGRWLHQHVGELGMYLACAAVFIGLSGLLLHRLIIGPGSLSRFYKLFSLAFAAYSVAWIVGWMLLRGHIGSLAGLFAGTALMAWIMVCAFDAHRSFLKVIAALFILNSLGYFIGGWVESMVMRSPGLSLGDITLSRRTRMTVAMLLWGVFYGIGFGAGLGYAFHACQDRARALLRLQTYPAPDSSPAPGA